MMVSIREQENELLDQWINSDLIVKDGIVDEKIFINLDSKVLVIMKETNNYLHKDKKNIGYRDLRVFLKEGARGATWNNIVRWTFGLQNLNRDIDEVWDDISYVNDKRRREHLVTIGSINLKKRPGSSMTNRAELDLETEKNITLLRKQIALYSDMNFILCGSRDVTDEIIKHNLFGALKFRQHKDTYVQVAEYDKTLVISYYHPQVRGKGSGSKVLFYNLIQSVKDYLMDKDDKFLDIRNS